MKDKMLEALEKDGKYLLQMTGKDHGPRGLTQDERDLIQNFTNVKTIPKGVRRYEEGIAPRTWHAQVLWERHEKVRIMYRSLIKHGFTKWEIADMMHVKPAAVRVMANKLSLIWELKGLGEERPR